MSILPGLMRPFHHVQGLTSLAPTMTPFRGWAAWCSATIISSAPARRTTTRRPSKSAQIRGSLTSSKTIDFS
jgi:hypothetical protein